MTDYGNDYNSGYLHGKCSLVPPDSSKMYCQEGFRSSYGIGWEDAQNERKTSSTDYYSYGYSSCSLPNIKPFIKGVGGSIKEASVVAPIFGIMVFLLGVVFTIGGIEANTNFSFKETFANVKEKISKQIVFFSSKPITTYYEPETANLPKKTSEKQSTQQTTIFKKTRRFNKDNYSTPSQRSALKSTAAMRNYSLPKARNNLS